MTTYFSATPKSLFGLQILSLIVILLGLFTVTVSWTYVLLAITFFYVYSILGVSVTLHRYYSHKSFKMNIVFKWILTAIAVLSGRGSPLGWVYIHRIHHATSDTEKDPHSPHNDSFKFIGFKPIYDDTKKINYFIVKELLTPVHINIDKYYMLLILAFVSLLAIIDFNLVFYVWALPVFMVSITQIMFNYFCHMHGYRNFETRDKSTNNVYMWPFIMGDAWHNNHHAHADKIHTGVKKYEFDPASTLINLIRK